jgi:hypothetical protein
LCEALETKAITCQPHGGDGPGKGQKVEHMRRVVHLVSQKQRKRLVVKNTINAVAKMAPWGGLPKRRVGSNIHCPHRGTNPNLTDPHLLNHQLGKPVAPHDKWYPDRKERGWRSGQRMLEKANAVL